MSAPPPRDPHGARSRAELAEVAEVERMFSRAVADHAAQQRARKQPYARLDRPAWCLYTADEWEQYDEWNALWDRQEARYGRFLPKAAALMRANRGVW